MSIFAPGVAIKKRPIEDGQPYAALTRAGTKTSEPDSARDRVAVSSVPTNWLRPSGGRPLRPLSRVLWQPSAAHITPPHAFLSVCAVERQCSWRLQRRPTLDRGSHSWELVRAMSCRRNCERWEPILRSSPSGQPMGSGRSRQFPITVSLRELDPRHGVSSATASPRGFRCEFRSASPMRQCGLETSRANPTHAMWLLAWPLVSTGHIGSDEPAQIFQKDLRLAAVPSIRTDSQPHLRDSSLACSGRVAPAESALRLANRAIRPAESRSRGEFPSVAPGRALVRPAYPSYSDQPYAAWLRGRLPVVVLAQPLPFRPLASTIRLLTRSLLGSRPAIHARTLVTPLDRVPLALVRLPGLSRSLRRTPNIVGANRSRYIVPSCNSFRALPCTCGHSNRGTCSALT